MPSQPYRRRRWRGGAGARAGGGRAGWGAGGCAPGATLPFAAVDRLTAGYAQVLGERGVQAGDRVALLLANEAAFPLTWIALSLLGAAAVPLNTRYQTADAEHVLRACRGAAVVTGEQFRPLLDRLPADVPALGRIITAPELAAE